MKSGSSSLLQRPARENSALNHVTADDYVAAGTSEEISYGSNDPLCARDRGVGTEDVDVQMHFLDNMQHATHFLKEHELERSKQHFSER